MYNEKENAEFLRNTVNEEIILPDSLKSENIEKLVSGEIQKKSKKGVIRRFAAVAVAACIMITSVVLLSDRGFISPENTVLDNIENSENAAVTESASSYDELLNAIKKYSETYKKNHIYLYSDVINEEAVDSVVGAPTYNGNITTDDSSLKVNYGEVNLREENVNEADIFITDGKYLYCIEGYGRMLKIIEAKADGSMEVKYSNKEAQLSEEGNGIDTYYHGLYKYENYLIVGFTRYEFEKHRNKSSVSGVMIYDVSDKAAPVLVKEIAIDGHYISSRITDGKLILISNYSIVEYFDAEDDSLLVPATYNGIERKTVPCDCISYIGARELESYINIAKIDLTDLDKEMKVASFLGKVSETYCTKDTLYTIGYDYSHVYNAVGDAVFGGVMISADNAKTIITSIDISEDQAKYMYSTELEGSILNSYSIDEYNGYLRIALQKSDENCIYVLNRKLEKVGEITGIAEGERIKSARFMGDTAYLVTFVQTDPLFVIDLSDPEKPGIVGEVKLPGFSSYLHPVGEGLLVGVGVGGTELGVDGSSKISLFDVKDPTSPKEIDSLVFPDSQLGTDPKAFCSVTESSFLVTYENWRLGEELYESENYRGYYIYTGALYVGVENNKLVLKNSYLAKALDSVKRTTFIDDIIYIYDNSFGSVASFNMNTSDMTDCVTGVEEEYIFTVPSVSNNEILF
ncbi:MAG: beta-propeller domain-containing protein [Clostridia bacterium]|nr:beta-propeller domain-containing protein [Clostridia bacterium]